MPNSQTCLNSLSTAYSNLSPGEVRTKTPDNYSVNRTKTNSILSFVAKIGKLKHVNTERVECILACAAAEAGSISAITVAVGRIERKFIKGSEGMMIYKPCVPPRRVEMNGPA